MKNVILKSLSLSNFRGCKQREINFSANTIISGANGLGKSTTFDAFTWLLFGKDQFDNKDSNIFPVIDGEILQKVDASVTGIIEVDGEKIELQRILRQKWTRRRGTAEEVYDGNETVCLINNVSVKIGEYKSYIGSIVDETLFSLITNPAYFLFSKNMDKMKRREVLFQLAGTLSDYEIAATNPDFLALLNSISGKSLANYKKEVVAAKTKANNELKMIKPKIEQTYSLMPEEKDFIALSTELDSIDRQIASIDNQMNDKSKAQNDLNLRNLDIQKEIGELQLQQNDVLNQKKREDSNRVFESNATRRELKNEISNSNSYIGNLERRKTSLEDQIKDKAQSIADIECEVNNLRDKWTEVNLSIYTPSNTSVVCPLYGLICDSPAASKNLEESNIKAASVFADKKAKELDDINEKGKAEASKIEKLKAQNKELARAIEDIKLEIATTKSAITQLQQKLDNTTEIQVSEVIPSSIPQWQELDNKILRLKGSIKDVAVLDLSEFKELKSNLVNERDNIKAKLSDRDTITKYKKEIADLEGQSKVLAQQIADLEKTEFTITSFTKHRIDECTQRINNLFSLVRFELFEYTIDGNESETCIAVNQSGVPISTTNTAEMVNAGLDIINTLCKFYNVSAPIFIDRAESVNYTIPTLGQTIKLIVTNEKELTIK